MGNDEEDSERMRTDRPAGMVARSGQGETTRGNTDTVLTTLG